MTFEDLVQPDSQFIYWAPVRYMVLDFEAGRGGVLDKNNHLELACWRIVESDRTYKDYHVFADEYGMQELANAIKGVAFVVAQNAKYELQWLKRMGLELRDILVYCTMLGQWVLDGNQRLPRNLNALAKKYGAAQKPDLIKKFWDAGIETCDIPRGWLLHYCANDVDSTHQVFIRQTEEVKRLNLEHIVYARNLACAALADIEFEGMTLDNDRVQAEWDKAQKELEEVELALDEMCGGINLNSSKQLAEFLFNKLNFDPPKDHKGKVIKTGKGAISTRADHLDKLKAETDEQKEFLRLYKRYNKLTSLISKNLEFFKGVCDERGGTFHAVFNQGITATHRLSSSGIPLHFSGNKKAKSVQFQNLPREYKRLFWSGDDNYLLGESDGAQLEFRVAADLGGDATAYEEIAAGADIHSVTAATLTAAGEPTDRQSAKSRTFRPLYGGSSGTVAEQEYCKFFANKYKGISETQRGWTLRVLNDKHLRTPYGLIFYWPDTRMERSYITNTTSIYNFPVQGFATGEIIPIALIAFWYAIREKPIRILNTVHDSVVAAVHKDEVQWYKDVSKRCFTLDVYTFLKNIYNYQFTVPLGCGIKVSRNWGDTKEEEKYNIFPDGQERRL